MANSDRFQTRYIVAQIKAAATEEESSARISLVARAMWCIYLKRFRKTLCMTTRPSYSRCTFLQNQHCLSSIRRTAGNTCLEMIHEERDCEAPACVGSLNPDPEALMAEWLGEREFCGREPLVSILKSSPYQISSLSISIPRSYTSRYKLFDLHSENKNQHQHFLFETVWSN